MWVLGEREIPKTSEMLRGPLWVLLFCCCVCVWWCCVCGDTGTLCALCIIRFCTRLAFAIVVEAVSGSARVLVWGASMTLFPRCCSTCP